MRSCWSIARHWIGGLRCGGGDPQPAGGGPFPLPPGLAASFAAYPAFLEELSRETGIPVALERRGMLYLPLDSKEENGLKGKLRRLLEQGRPASWLRPEDIVAKLPWLEEPWPRYGLFLEKTARVHPPDLLRALRASLEALGVRIRENLHHVGLEARAGGSVPRFHVVLQG